MQKLSSYVDNLKPEAKDRYLRKISTIGDVDPFVKPVAGEIADCVPPVEASDLVAYLVLQTSFITSAQFKARKGLEAYNQFVSGWIKEVNTRKICGKYLTVGRVQHSQRLNETPLSCWIIIENSGEVCCAHCTCMAGLGETCTHIAAILFYLEATARIQGTTTTCTQQACQWIVPAYFKKIEYLPIKNIDFTSAWGKKRKLDEVIDATEPSMSKCSKTYPATGENSTESEMAIFFESLSNCKTKPAVLSVVPMFSENYVPKSSLVTFPKPLTTLYQSDFLQLNYDKLLEHCESVLVDITQEMANTVEQETRAQSQSKFWFKQRAGRVTASKMKAVCHTNLAHPSHSLIKTICYPEEFNFSSKQTAYGSKNEKKARELYYKTSIKNHDDFEWSESGLVINPKWPVIGASPDGVVNCTCCGKGVLEIKCPYSHQNTHIQDAASQDRTFCLKEVDGSLQLDNSHAYYYQIQTQLFVCNVEYCDFCVCTFVEDDESKGLHIERIYKNETFWSDCISKAEQFFKTCLLPEILGKYYTRPNSILTQVTDNAQPSINDIDTQKLSTSSVNSEASNTDDASGSSSKSASNAGDISGSSSKYTSSAGDISGSSSKSTSNADDISGSSSSRSTSDASSNSSTVDQKLSASNSSNDPDDDEEPTYCYCNGPDKGKMIACDNPACPLEWFHVRCLGIRYIPKGKWYCPECEDEFKQIPSQN